MVPVTCSLFVDDVFFISILKGPTNALFNIWAYNIRLFLLGNSVIHFLELIEVELLKTQLDFLGTCFGDSVSAKLMRQLDILEEDVVIHDLHLRAPSFVINQVFIISHILNAPLSNILIDDFLSVHVEVLFVLHCAVLTIGDAVLRFEVTVAVGTCPTDWPSDKLDVAKNVL